MKQTQRQIVLNKLKEDGYVSRNWCLQNYISRLSAIMYELEREGMHFTTENKDGNYFYRLVKEAKQDIIEPSKQSALKAFTQL